MKLLLIIAVLVLAGCGSNPIVPDTVKIPVPVACKTPTPNAPTLRYAPPYDSVFEAVRDLLGDREVMKAYEDELATALKSCK